jgi:hypothetical protein
MLALREVVELEKESFVEKLYYKWILTFNILVQALTSIFSETYCSSVLHLFYLNHLH